MVANVYLEGRTQKNLFDNLNKPELSNYAFINDRIDKNTVLEGSYEHCTFANVSFKEAKILKTKFTNCVFIGCYFRKSDLTISDEFTQLYRFRLYSHRMNCEIPTIELNDTSLWCKRVKLILSRLKEQVDIYERDMLEAN